jgi:hypothetical protein
MKPQRIFTALSLLLLSAVIPQLVLAVGDSNLDSGVGTDASRGPWGYNNTGSKPIYDTPPNTYGVWRDANGALRDAGMTPDNLTTYVHQPTWEEAHPVGPPHLAGSPGGLGGAVGGGGVGISTGGIGFGLGSGMGAFGAFTGVSPFASAATAALTNPTPTVGGSGLGPFGSAPRTAFGFAGTGGEFFPVHPFLGGVNAGPGGGFTVDPKVTSTNVTQGGVSTTTTTFNTTFGPSQFQQTTMGTGNNANTTLTLTINGNVFKTQVQGPPPTVTNGSFFGLSNIPIPINNPAPNTTVTSTLVSNNATTNPAVPAGAFFNPNAIAQGQGSAGNFGANTASPATSGSALSFFQTNTPQQGNFGAGFATPQTAGIPSSVFFGGSFASTTIGGGFPTEATSGGPRSASFPNADLGNDIGIGGGSLGSVAFGIPGFATPNIASALPGFSTSAGGSSFLGGGFSGIGYGPVVGNAPQTASAPANLTNPTTGTTTGTSISSTGTTNPNPDTGVQFDDQGFFGSDIEMDMWGPNGFVPQGRGPGLVPSRSGGPSSFGYGGYGPMAPGALRSFGNGPSGQFPFGGRGPVPPAPVPFGVSGGYGPGGRGSYGPGPYGPGGMGSYGPGGIGSYGPGAYGPGGMGSYGNQGSGRADATKNNGGLGPVNAGTQSNCTKPGIAMRNSRRRLAAVVPFMPLDNGDGAFGFFGGTTAMEHDMREGLEGKYPYLGNAPTPGQMFSAGRYVHDWRTRQSLAISGIGPIGNTTTDLECKLAKMNLTICDAIGTVIGSTRFDNGDILTYGTAGTLRLSTDNSGSITFNDGEILTFGCAEPEVRKLALKSTLYF